MAVLRDLTSHIGKFGLRSARQGGRRVGEEWRRLRRVVERLGEVLPDAVGASDRVDVTVEGEFVQDSGEQIVYLVFFVPTEPGKPQRGCIKAWPAGPRAAACRDKARRATTIRDRELGE